MSLTAVVSVCLSVCHTREPRPQSTRYRTFRTRDVCNFFSPNFVDLNLAVHLEPLSQCFHNNFGYFRDFSTI